MNAEKDIFDLTNLSDLSPEMQKEAKIRSFELNNDLSSLLHLFDLKAELNTAEIVVGLARKFHLEKTRGWVRKTITNLRNRKLIKLTSTRGVYTKA
jgi:hypothetical protein